MSVKGVKEKATPVGLRLCSEPWCGQLSLPIASKILDVVSS